MTREDALQDAIWRGAGKDLEDELITAILAALRAAGWEVVPVDDRNRIFAEFWRMLVSLRGDTRDDLGFSSLGKLLFEVEAAFPAEYEAMRSAMLAAARG